MDNVHTSLKFPENEYIMLDLIHFVCKIHKIYIYFVSTLLLLMTEFYGVLDKIRDSFLVCFLFEGRKYREYKIIPLSSICLFTPWFSLSVVERHLVISFVKSLERWKIRMLRSGFLY